VARFGEIALMELLIAHRKLSPKVEASSPPKHIDGAVA